MIEIQFGAGGVVTQPTPTGPWFIGIHHRKHDEWSLPKGTWKPGETLEETALRGVEEKTGFSLRFAGTAGLVHYLKPGTLQPVLFWIMVPEGHNRFTPSKEVDRFERFPLSQAVDRLGFAEEKELVTQALAQPSPNLSKEDNERLRARLEDECHQTRRLTPDGSGEPLPWEEAIEALLQAAHRARENGNVAWGWKCLRDIHRLEFPFLTPKALEERANLLLDRARIAPDPDLKNKLHGLLGTQNGLFQAPLSPRTVYLASWGLDHPEEFARIQGSGK